MFFLFVQYLKKCTQKYFQPWTLTSSDVILTSFYITGRVLPFKNGMHLSKPLRNIHTSHSMGHSGRSPHAMRGHAGRGPSPTHHWRWHPRWWHPWWRQVEWCMTSNCVCVCVFAWGKRRKKGASDWVAFARGHMYWLFDSSIPIN